MRAEARRLARQRRDSEMRLRAPVVVQEAQDENDPYADVPCTD